MRMRRGQAALEFLTTYGWAFLVILVMIGALAYFGVLSPNRFLPERCTFQQEVTCKDFTATKNATGGTVSFVITNNLGNGIEDMIISATSASDANSVAVPCVPVIDFATTPLDSQKNKEFVCDGTAGTVFGSLPAKGTKHKFIVNGTYKELGGSYYRAIAGELFVTLQ